MATSSTVEELSESEDELQLTDIAKKFLEIEDELNKNLEGLNFGPEINSVLNPLEYASEPHQEYVENYCNGTKKILFLGENPGRWGMTQTGIPFGDVKMVREWLKISVNGAVEVTERSGSRLWSLIQEKFREHEQKEDSDKAKLEEYCDEALRNIIELLEIKTVIGIGKYAKKRANAVKKAAKMEHVRVVYMEHPATRRLSPTDWKTYAWGVIKNEYKLLSILIPRQKNCKKVA